MAAIKTRGKGTELHVLPFSASAASAPATNELRQDHQRTEPGLTEAKSGERSIRYGIYFQAGPYRLPNEYALA